MENQNEVPKMSWKEHLKEEGTKEREKLKNMPPKDRAWYIWEYYKIHIFILIGLFMLLGLLGEIFYNKTFTTQLSYATINNFSPNYSFEEFNEEFKAVMGYGKKDVIEADGSMVIRYGDVISEMEYGNMAKVSALVAAQDLDILICDQLNIDHYAELDGFRNLKETLPKDLWQKVEPFVYYGKNEAGEEIPCGIDLSNSYFCKKTGIDMNPCYLGIVNNTARIDTVISWIDFALEGE